MAAAFFEGLAQGIGIVVGGLLVCAVIIKITKMQQVKK